MFLHISRPARAGRCSARPSNASSASRGIPFTWNSSTSNSSSNSSSPWSPSWTRRRRQAAASTSSTSRHS
eukprot:1793682-Heterocapsa_arctica.AAC.1